MKRKNYLVEELSKEEKLYLKRIIMTAKNKYIERNCRYINNVSISLNNVILESQESFIEAVLEKCLKETISDEQFEKRFLNSKLSKYVRALSLPERKVLFYLYEEKKEINEIAQIMNLYRGTIRRIRDKALAKIGEKLIKEL